MNQMEHGVRWKTLLAFAIIYFVWGSTFYFIRVGVQQFPPLLMAALRFLIAGGALVGWAASRGEKLPGARLWTSILTLAFLMFVVDYGLLFWAEQRVASGVAAVMMATIPAFMALAEIILLRTRRLTLRLAAALLIGIGGVAVLVSHSLNLGASAIDFTGASMLIIGSISWGVASALARKLPLPESKVMSSGSQMFTGGILLAVVSGIRGEFSEFHFAAVTPAAWIALAYLVVFGSIVGFTAYVWLIHRESPTRVGTYAYVNPVVAVVLGHWVGGEPLGVRTVAGALCVLTSVVLITTSKARKTE